MNCSTVGKVLIKLVVASYDVFSSCPADCHEFVPHFCTGHCPRLMAPVCAALSLADIHRQCLNMCTLPPECSFSFHELYAAVEAGCVSLCRTATDRLSTCMQGTPTASTVSLRPSAPTTQTPVALRWAQKTTLFSCTMSTGSRWGCTLGCSTYCCYVIQHAEICLRRRTSQGPPAALAGRWQCLACPDPGAMVWAWTCFLRAAIVPGHCSLLAQCAPPLPRWKE